MSILNLIKGEPMPDKNDPKYRERYEKEVQAGRDFAEKTGLTWVSGHITDWACRNKKLFLAIVFGLVFLCFALNIFHVYRYITKGKQHQPTAVEMVDHAMEKPLQERNHNMR